MGNDAALSARQRRALARVSTLPFARDVYLVGGTAIALHLGHQRSLDIDLFSRPGPFDLEAARRALVAATPRAEIIEQSDVTLHLRLEGADVDIVRYPYRLLAPAKRSPLGIRVAGLRDLATMKLAAIAKRGLRRDFWDLHEIVFSGRVSLARALEDYRKKFGTSEADIYHVPRALTWFEDAERESVMPRGLGVRRWRRIRADFEALVGTLLDLDAG